MSFVVRLIGVWSIWITCALAQDYSYTLEGTYPISSQSFTPLKVSFILRWNETGNRVEGVYTDNYFANSAAVAGTTTAQGRNFNMVFAQPTQGIKTINFSTAQVGLFNGTTPLRITTANPTGVPVDTGNLLANMTSMGLDLAKSGAQTCIVGFGVFSGFCGQYAGTISEESDPANQCSLIGQGISKLEMGNNMEIRLFQNVDANNVKDKPYHPLGNLPSSPLTPNVQMTNRVCGSLPNTTFPGTGCKVLSLTGAFQELGGSPNFTGTYTISDEASRASCRYNMNLFRDVPY